MRANHFSGTGGPSLTRYQLRHPHHAFRHRPFDLFPGGPIFCQQEGQCDDEDFALAVRWIAVRVQILEDFGCAQGVVLFCAYWSCHRWFATHKSPQQ
jgi:hypothetical protein